MDNSVLKRIIKDNMIIFILCFFYIISVYGVINFILDKPELLKFYLFNWLIWSIAIIFSIVFLLIKLLSKQNSTYFQIDFILGFFIILLSSIPYISTFASYKQAI